MKKWRKRKKHRIVMPVAEKTEDECNDVRKEHDEYIY